MTEPLMVESTTPVEATTTSMGTTPVLDPVPAAIVPAQFALPPERLDVIHRNVIASQAKGVPFNGVGVLYVSWVRETDGARFSATIIGGFAMAEKFGHAVQRFEQPSIVVIGRRPYQGLPPKGAPPTDVFKVPEHILTAATNEERRLLVPSRGLKSPAQGVSPEAQPGAEGPSADRKETT